MGNIDCLVCHSDSYKRKVAPVGTTLKFVPAAEKMTVSLIEAITDIKPPSRGSDSTATRMPEAETTTSARTSKKPTAIPRALHSEFTWRPISAGGAGMVCTDCHVVQNRRIAGRGVDLCATALDVPVACTNCHTFAETLFH